MNKIGKIIIGIVLLLVVVGLGLFCWQKWQQKQEESLGYVQFNEFAKQELNNEVYFENKESGLRFKVPAGWTPTVSQLASVALISPDFKPFKDNPSAASVPATGCWIGVSTKKTLQDDSDYSMVRNYLTYQNFINREDKKYKIIDLSGKKLLETDYSINNEDNIGSVTTIEYVGKNELYSFTSYFFGKDHESCSQSFDDFLKTISIK
ncbi:MAG: hypothetical protein PHR14_08135 [Oscillospiraceae bacterium]|nr:hypothetical protein [Oscillospiraceae bacterium]